MYYKLIPINVPANLPATQVLERQLEQIHAKGGELVCVIPTTTAITVIGVFRAAQRSILEEHKAEWRTP